MAPPTSPPAITFQGTLPVAIKGPRRIAAAASGKLFVADSKGKLHMLTKRGDLIAAVGEGVRAIAAGEGKLFAISKQAELVTLDPRDGKVLSRVALGVGEAPVGIAYDAPRELLWMAFQSGVVQARRTDGTLALQPSPKVTGALYRLVDVAVDASAGIVWVAQESKASGGMIFGLNATTGARVKVIGANGAGPVTSAGSIAVDGAGQLVVTDMFSGEVEVVTAADVPVRTVALDSAGLGKRTQPAATVAMANGDLLVASVFASRLDRFGDGSPLPTCEGDADCDELADAWETTYGLDPNDPRDSLRDSDGDGVKNLDEYALGTNPAAADTDGDGFSDGAELASGYDPLNPKDHLPVVVAGSGGEYAPGRVALSASVSNVSDVAACKAAWTQTGGAPVTLSGADGFSPSFLARKAGAYTFSVVATCGGLVSDPAAGGATVLNLAPVPNALRVATVEVGEELRLSARRSSDANGDALSFAWEQLEGVSVAGPSKASSISPTFSSSGSYRFRVAVADPAKATAVAELSVVALGKKPVPAASVASPVLGAVGQPIALDASGSYRHDDAVFSWEQVAGPAVTLAGAATPVAGFVASSAGRYAFEVVISQNNVSSPAARVEVFVAEAGQPLPVAVATAEPVAAVGTAALLDGNGSTSGSGNSLAYAWRQVSGPAAGLGQAASAVASAWFFEPGSYEFELTVKDGEALSAPTRVRVEARKDGRAIPVARVVAPTRARVGQEIKLDGRASTGAESFRWTQLAGPWVMLEGDSVEEFRLREAGTYVFELEVDDGQVRSAPTRVSVVVSGDGKEE